MINDHILQVTKFSDNELECNGDIDDVSLTIDEYIEHLMLKKPKGFFNSIFSDVDSSKIDCVINILNVLGKEIRKKKQEK